MFSIHNNSLRREMDRLTADLIELRKLYDFASSISTFTNRTYKVERPITLHLGVNSPEAATEVTKLKEKYPNLQIVVMHNYDIEKKRNND